MVKFQVSEHCGIGGEEMYGAILGDMIGAPYEFEKKQKKSKDFDMFNRRIHFTDVVSN